MLPLLSIKLQYVGVELNVNVELVNELNAVVLMAITILYYINTDLHLYSHCAALKLPYPKVMFVKL